MKPFLPRFHLLAELVQLASIHAMDMLNDEQILQLKGIEVCWVMESDGGAQWSYFTGKMGDPDGSEADLQVEGGCAEEGPEYIGTDRILGQSRAFALLKVGWVPDDLVKFGDLLAAAHIAENHHAWVKAWLKTADCDINWFELGSFSAFKASADEEEVDPDESNMTEYEPFGLCKVLGDLDPDGDVILQLPGVEEAVYATSIDFDTVAVPKLEKDGKTPSYHQLDPYVMADACCTKYPFRPAHWSLEPEIAESRMKLVTSKKAIDGSQLALSALWRLTRVDAQTLQPTVAFIAAEIAKRYGDLDGRLKDALVLNGAYHCIFEPEAVVTLERIFEQDVLPSLGDRCVFISEFGKAPRPMAELDFRILFQKH